MTGTLREDLCTFMIIWRWILFRMRNVSQKVVKKIKTHFMFNNSFFPRNFDVYEIMWREKSYSQTSPDASTAHGHWMLDNWGYRHTHWICNTYCFSTETAIFAKDASVVHTVSVNSEIKKVFTHYIMPNVYRHFCREKWREELPGR